MHLVGHFKPTGSHNTRCADVFDTQQLGVCAYELALWHPSLHSSRAWETRYAQPILSAVMCSKHQFPLQARQGHAFAA